MYLRHFFPINFFSCVYLARTKVRKHSAKNFRPFRKSEPFIKGGKNIQAYLIQAE